MPKGVNAAFLSKAFPEHSWQSAADGLKDGIHSNLSLSGRIKEGGEFINKGKMPQVLPAAAWERALKGREGRVERKISRIVQENGTKWSFRARRKGGTFHLSSEGAYKTILVYIHYEWSENLRKGMININLSLLRKAPYKISVWKLNISLSGA